MNTLLWIGACCIWFWAGVQRGRRLECEVCQNLFDKMLDEQLVQIKKGQTIQ